MMSQPLMFVRRKPDVLFADESCRTSRLGLLGGQLSDLGKTGGIGQSKFRQHFAVYGNIGLFEAIDKLAVRQIVHTRCSIDPYDPQLTKIAFTLTPVAVGIVQRFINGIGTLDLV